MTDKEIVEALIARDERVTRLFFFEKCRPLFLSIIDRIFPFNVEYDEFVNELYFELLKDDAQKLRQFEGRSSIFQWLKTVAIRFFMRRRDELVGDCTNEPPTFNEDITSEDSPQSSIAHHDLKQLLKHINNNRFVHALQRLIIDDAPPQTVADEMNITVDNLYNIKKRAITALTQVALNDIKHYGKQIKQHF